MARVGHGSATRVVAPLPERRVVLYGLRLRCRRLAVFAAVLNASVSTVRKGGIDNRRPSGSSPKLLTLIDRKGLDAVL